MLCTLAAASAVGNVAPVGCPTFTCAVEEGATPAASVHALRPQDIKLVAAFGDSLTAAFGAEASNKLEEFGELREYRKDSWSGGGGGSYASTCTLPNILGRFSGQTAALPGAATGDTWIPLSADRPSAGLDVAVSGSLADDFESQAQRMVNDMGRLKGVNVTGDWKVATVFTGGNDLCDVCYRSSWQQSAYIASLEKGLDYLLANVPRLLVNLVAEVDVSLLALLNSSTCSVPREWECGCIGEGADSVAKMHSAAMEMQQAMHKIAALPRYQQRDDWTVVVQTMYENFTFPRDASGKPDATFFSPDCFHYSTKGHASAAVALWNNMLQPVGHKSSWSPALSSSLQCPTAERPYLATQKNSLRPSTLARTGAGAVEEAVAI